MKTYIQGLVTGILFSIAILFFIASTNHSSQVGRYEYYINNDDITKKHYSRIFDTATGEVYHKTYTPGLDQVDVKWVNGEKIEKKHFRPDLTVWRSETWDEFKKSYQDSRNAN
tara:strand:- start:1067 stop:1405 length:339 start_codon:yes stop_codon:yes gene_type:complete